MPFDISSIKVDDYKEPETEVSTGNSEPAPMEEVKEPTSTEATPAEVVTEKKDENPNVVAQEPNDEPAPESKPSEEPRAKTGKPLTRVERAEYSASKWKKKYKSMKRERDAALAEFNKYKDFNPDNFENPQDAHQYMAWKASAQQRIEDMNEDMRSYYNEKRGEEYEAKIGDCFKSEERADEYRELDDKYDEAFNVACDHYDPDNVIRDFVENSRFEPALKTIIYRNGQLQEDLFREYSNPKIGAIKRMQILEALERNVDAYYRQQAGQPAPQPVTQQAPVTHKTVKRFTLPERKSTTPVKTPEVTGSLTKGNDVGEPDEQTQVTNAYYSIFGKRP